MKKYKVLACISADLTTSGFISKRITGIFCFHKSYFLLVGLFDWGHARAQIFQYHRVGMVLN